MPRNPSAALARRLAASPRLRLLGLAPRAVVLTTAYRSLVHELAPALAEAPMAVLMLGVAGRTRAVRVERRGTGRRSTLFPDVAGKTASGPGRAGAAAVRQTRVAPGKVLRILQDGGVPSRISRDAGRYLCNAAYFQALAEPKPVLFVHVPKPPQRGRAASDRKLAAALTNVAIALGVQARVAGLRPLG